MLALLPLAAYILLLLAFRRAGSEWRAAFLHAATAWGVLAVLMVEGLSAPRWLTVAGLAAVWLAVDLGLIAWLLHAARADARAPGGAEGPRPPAPDGPLALADRAALAGVVIIIVLVGITALLGPPNTWDVMQYHLPRVVHWLENATVAFYPTHDLKQLHMAPGSEYLVAQLHALSGGDRLDNLVQWLAFAGSVVGVTLIARSLGAGRRGQVLAAVVCATIPQGILQASSAKNDYVLAFWLVTLACYVFRLGSDSAWGSFLGASAALALACLTKATAYALAPPLLLAWAATLPRGARMTLVKRLPVAALVVLALNAPHGARNLALFGSPLGPGAVSPPEAFKYTNDRLDGTTVVANVARNVALHFASADQRSNATVERWARRLLAALGIDPDDPATTWTGSRFHLRDRALHEVDAGNTLHLLLIGVTLATLLARRSVRAHRDIVLYALGLVLAFLVFCLVLKWQPFHSRLHLPLFVLWSPAVAAVAAMAWPVPAAYALAAGLLALSGDAALSNELRPLVARKGASVFTRSRHSQYFADRPPLTAAYVAAADLVRRSGCRDIGLDLSTLVGDQYEYPWLALLGAGGPDRDVRLVGLENTSTRYAEGAARSAPCAVVCVNCLAAMGAQGRYSSGWNQIGRGSVLVLLARDLPVPPGAAEARALASVRLALNGNTFRAGDDLKVGVEVSNPSKGPPAELYVGAVLADGESAIFLSGAGRFSGPMSLSAPASFPAFTTAPPGFSLDAPSLAEVTLPKSGVQAGRYRVFAALLREGALRGTQIDPDDILALDVREVLLSP